jgi:quinol-cytochrome oxidoreductase complex cytochrome b subunit
MLAALTHLWCGGSLRDLLGTWLLVQMGFWGADIAAALFRAPLYTIGDLQIVAATAGGFVISVFQIVTRRRV